MTLFIISIPFMVLAVVFAVLPLVVMSVAEHHRMEKATPRGHGDGRANVAEPQDQELPEAA
jgi:hypothetical protein